MDASDICIIGSGIASTLTLIEVLNSLLSNAPAKKKKIIVIEKHHEFWKGIPYGSRSSVNALTITSIQDFINENERPAFFSWLKDTQDKWLNDYRANGGSTAAKWIDNNLVHLENSAWETVYVPRFLYGNYQAQKVNRLVQEAEEKQLLELFTIQAEAINIQPTGGELYEVTIEQPDGTTSKIVSRKVVISTGSAPVRKMCDIASEQVFYVNDIYEPSANANIQKIQEGLNKTTDAKDRNILIIGSNASSIELLYLIEGLPELRKLINQTVVISSSGILPHSTSFESLPHHPLPNLDKVNAAGNYTIETLTDAAALDIGLAVSNGANMDYVATIISTTLKLMEVLGEDARKAFFAIHAIRLRNMFRRAGPDYKNVAQALIDLQEATLLKGRFISAAPSDNGAQLHYLDNATGTEQTHPLTFRAILNCSGSDDLDQSSSRLLYNLVKNDTCKMNLSGKGFEVNEKFEAAPNLYVMGPLLGGNVNKLIHFWQLENASRLTYLAPYLAGELVG